MGELNISINNRPFQIACEDGDEPRVTRLAEDLAARISRIKQDVGEAGDARLLVLAGLMLCDELRNLREGNGAAQDNVAPIGETHSDAEQAMIDGLHKAAARVDAILASFDENAAE